MTDLQSSEPRAGFWRRLAAALIDGLIVGVPLQILVVPLYLLTNGAVQFHGGVTYKDCSQNVQISQLPPGLDPAPPENSNYAVICRTSLFGLTTAQNLTVARKTKTGNTTTSVSQSYLLGPDGKPTRGWSLDSAALLVLIAYLFLSETYFGRTGGKRLLGIRVVDLKNPEKIRVPLRKVALRYFLMWAGVWPMFIALFVPYLANGGDIEATSRGSVFIWLALSGIFCAIWCLWIFVQIVCKRDPIYDRIAGTAVLKRAI